MKRPLTELDRINDEFWRVQALSKEERRKYYLKRAEQEDAEWRKERLRSEIKWRQEGISELAAAFWLIIIWFGGMIIFSIYHS